MKNLKFFIIAFISLQIKSISEWFFNKGREASFKRAKKVAKRRFKIDGKTYYILQGERWVFFVLNSLELDNLKRVRMFKKDLNIKELNELCCYKVGATCPKGNEYENRLLK